MPPSLRSLPLKCCLIGAVVVSAVFVGLVLLLYTDTFSTLGQEDGIIENAGALCFFLAAIFFLRLFLKMRKASKPYPNDMGAWPWYLILGILFLFITGEEISWGQRLFGWDTPDAIKESNRQGETNIHNLEIFHALDEDDQLKPFWQKFLAMNRLFSMFWLLWCLVLPLGVHFSEKFRQLVAWFRVPVPAICFGCFFFAIYVTAKIFTVTMDPPREIGAQIEEIKEAVYAALFLMVSWNFFKRSNQQPE